MMLSELLQRLSGQPTISGRRRFSQSLRQLEALEHRALPAGNVTAQFIGRTLYVNGDSAANSVELAAESGNLVMRGLDGTTVNGSSSTVTLLSAALSFLEDSMPIWATEMIGCR